MVMVYKLLSHARDTLPKFGLGGLKVTAVVTQAQLFSQGGTHTTQSSLTLKSQPPAKVQTSKYDGGMVTA